MTREPEGATSQPKNQAAMQTSTNIFEQEKRREKGKKKTEARFFFLLFGKSNYTYVSYLVQHS